MSLRGFGFTLDIQSGATRQWYVDSLGAKRWVYGDGLVDNQRNSASVSVQRQDAQSNEQKEGVQ
jgi:hypothetical protein